MSKSFLLFFAIIYMTTVQGGIKMLNQRLFTCDENSMSTFAEIYQTNCTTRIPSDTPGKYYCGDAGCENGSWQATRTRPKSSPFDYDRLACCKELCDSFDCDGLSLHDSDYQMKLNSSTEDYGRTWFNPADPANLPLCPGNKTRICMDILDNCPRNTKFENYFGWSMYCISSSCQGEMVYNSKIKTWNCVNPACDTSMVFLESKNKWICPNEACPNVETIYSSFQRKYLCPHDSEFCKGVLKGLDQCHWSF